MCRRPPIFTLFPYTTLFRSAKMIDGEWQRRGARKHAGHHHPEQVGSRPSRPAATAMQRGEPPSERLDRKSTRLNSSHANISYAVFCLKKKKNTRTKKSYDIR